MIVTPSPKAGQVVDQGSDRIRQPARPRWRSAYAGFLGALIILYVAGYGTLLYATDGLPYVLDNNESFSTLLHATNLYRFGLSKSFGITDEATGPDPAAHPFVHTHQGNFPRVFGFLIYALGARTIEAQIVVTTFTIGIVVVLMTYHVFARLAGPPLAFVTCLILLSDYIHVVQWQVNTYRVWHFFLVFSSLACVYGLGGERRRLWLGLTFVNALALFYCELVSVAFTSILAGLFAIALHWRRPRRIVAWTVAHTAGGLASLAILVGQLIAYLGWESFLEDVRLTFGARNSGAANEQVRESIVRFYQEHNILFWENFVDGAPLRSLAAMIDLHARYVFQIYTPFLTLVVLVLAFGWLLGRSWGYGTGWRMRRLRRADDRPAVLLTVESEPYVHGSLEFGVPELRPDERRQLQRADGALRVALLIVPISITLLMVFQGERILGMASAPTSPANLLIGALVALVAGTGVALALIQAGTGSWVAVGRLPLGRLLAVASLLLMTSLVIGLQPGVYDPAYRLVWYDPFAAIVPLWLERAALLLALGLAVTMCAYGTERVLGAAWSARLNGLGVYLLCAGVAYVVTYHLATGYVQSGYVTRAAPLPVFFVGVLVAFAACVVVAAAARAWSLRPRPSGDLASGTVRSRLFLGTAAGSLLLLLAGYWVVLNGVYVSLLPPNQFAALYKQFTRPPLLGAPTVVNNYGTPIAVLADNWTYYDHLFGTRELYRDGPNGFERIPQPTSYVWLADRAVNPTYVQPDVFVCIRTRNFDTYMIRPPGQPAVDPADCAQVPLIQQIERDRQRIVEHKLVDRDRSKPSTWAIVQLDWELPPRVLLPPNRPSEDAVQLTLTPGANGIVAQVQYTYVQQQGVPERQSTLRLHAAGADGKWCLYERSSSRSTFTLPADFRGKIRASVTPRTASKAGRETFGAALTIGDGQGAPCVGKE